MKAWRTTCVGVECIVAADSRAKAKHTTAKSARDAGYTAEWTGIRAVREPKYDGWANGAVPVDGHCWNEVDVAKAIQK